MNAGGLWAEIRELQGAVHGLATRAEILDIERLIRGLAADLMHNPDARSIETVAAEADAVQARLRAMAGDPPASARRRVGSAIDLLAWRIEDAASWGIEASDLRRLGAELDRLRSGLAETAEPQRIEQVAHDLDALRDLVADLRRQRDGSARSARGARFSPSSLDRRNSPEGRSAEMRGRPVPESLAPIAERLAAVENGLAELKEQAAPELAAMASGIEHLARDVEQIASDGTQAIDRLEGRFDRLDAVLRDVVEDLDRTPLAAAIEASQAQLASLDRRVEQIAAEVDIDTLLSRLDSLHGALDGLRASSRTPVTDPVLLDRIKALDGTLRGLAAREPESLDPLKQGLAAIAGRLDRLVPEGTSDPLGLKAHFGRLSDRLDGADAGRAAASEGLAERLGRVESLLTAGSPLAAGLDRLGRIEGMLAGQPVALDRLNGQLERLDESLRHVAQMSDTASVEILLRSFGSRLDEIRASREGVESLERQIASLAAALDRTGRPDPALDLLHRTLTEAMAEMRSLRDGSAPAGHPRAGEPGQPAFEALARDLQDLKARHAAREDRTQQALSAIQTALGTLSLRIGAQDPAAAGGTPAPAAARHPQTLAAPAPAAVNNPTAPAAPASAETRAAAAPPAPDPAAAATPTSPPATGSAGAAPGESPAVVTLDATTRPSPGTNDETSWSTRLRAALLGRRAPSPGTRDPDAGLQAPPAAEPLPEMPKAVVPAFRPIVIDASGAIDPGSVRSSFIAALRRTQTPTGETGEAAPGRDSVAGSGDAEAAPASRLRDGVRAHRGTLVLGTAAAALAVGGWHAAGTPPVTNALAALSLQVESLGQAMLAKSGTSTAKPAAAGVAPAKHQTSVGTGGPAAAVPEASPRPAAEAVQTSAQSPVQTLTPSQAQTATQSPAQSPAQGQAQSPASRDGAPPAVSPAGTPIDGLPAGIPARLKPAVLAGHPSALYELAFLLVQGRDLPRDPALGAKLLERAAAAGLAPAQYSLGQLYESGVGVPQNVAMAQSWYRRAAERGNARAMQNLGVLLAAGADGKSDYPAALPWFRQAADLGVRDSQYNLAVILAWGIGTPRNPVEAYKWFAVVAKGGDQEAAAKRDELARELSPGDLAAAKALAENWRARTADHAANTVPALPQGVSEAPPPATTKGRV